jgi:hypothetical protein
MRGERLLLLVRLSDAFEMSLTRDVRQLDQLDVMKCLTTLRINFRRRPSIHIVALISGYGPTTSIQPQNFTPLLTAFYTTMSLCLLSPLNMSYCPEFRGLHKDKRVCRFLKNSFTEYCNQNSVSPLRSPLSH